MDQEISVPLGWSRTVQNGRALYISPPPFPVKIYSQTDLALYQKKGRFLDIMEDQLVFGRKRKKKEKKYLVNKMSSRNWEASGAEVQGAKACGFSGEEAEEREPESGQAPNAAEKVESSELEEPRLATQSCVADHSGEDIAVDDFKNTASDQSRTKLLRKKKDIKKKMEDEHSKIADAVSKLTLDPEKKVSHKSVLEDAARRLNEARLRMPNCQDSKNLDDLKGVINGCNTEDEIANVIWSNPVLQSRFSSLFNSKLLEQVLSLGNLSTNPMKSFPVDINSNLYADIVNFGLDHAPDVILLLLNLTKKLETPLSAKDVIELAFSFSSLSEASSSQNKALKKIKSICLRSSGLTNAGLDSMASVGATETSRSFRNDRDLLASMSEEIVKQYARKSTAQFTFDNLDICINKTPHHLTLNFLEFEPSKTLELRAESKSLEEMLDFFSFETILLKSKENQDMFKHHQFVTAHTLARLFGKEIKGMEWLRSVFPKHYKHLNSKTASRKSLMHVDKPMYLQETKNSDMFKIMDNLQLEFLNLIGEQAEDKERYFKDLKLIMSVDCDVKTREDAERRVKEQEKVSGVLICHGDQLTKERFENCKRLKQGSTSAFERYEFMPVFRMGMFHLRMNKTIQDYQSCMKSVVNIEDELSLGFFRTTLGLNLITNNPDTIKRCGEFERHDQFMLEVGKEMLINAFKTFMETNFCPVNKNIEETQSLILRFLDHFDIKYFYDKENFNEKVFFDDCLSSCRDIAGRATLSLIADTVEKEGDGLGIRAVRKVMMMYMLNRKEAQTSKYAKSLLSDLVTFMGASEKTKARIDMLATCNPSGGVGTGLARDEVNEHYVRQVKDTVKGLHSQLTDSVLAKAVLGGNVLSQIKAQDEDSMLMPSAGGGTSHRYLSEEQRMKIREDIEKFRPFDKHREKFEYYDKSTGSVFSGLTSERVEWFLKRNQTNFRRSFPHKNRM